MDENIRRVPAASFKADCLRLMDEVAHRRAPIIVTKRGKPIVKLVPVEDHPIDLFGWMAGTATIRGDIVEPTGAVWEADADRQ